MPPEEEGLASTAGRPRLRPPRPDEVEIINYFAYSIGISPSAIYVSIAVLEVPGARYQDIFDVPGWSLEATGPTGAFSAGFYIGYIEGGRFKPGLPLAWRLSRLCGIALQCHEVDEFGEKVFLYGKPVYEDHVRAWAPGVSVVLGPRGDPLGWGRPEDKAKKGGRLLAPIADLGWYLRRGG